MPHLHILHYDIKDKKDLFFHTGIRTMGMQLLSVFLPIILFVEVGLSLSEIFLFFALWSLGIVILTWFVTARFVSRFGTKATMMVGMPFLAIMFIGIHFLTILPWLLYLLPLFGSAYTAFFWVGFHTDISQSAHRKHFGSKMALLNIVVALLGAIVPFFGGVIIDTLGVGPLLLIGGLLLILSIIPLLHTSQLHKPVAFCHATMRELMSHSKAVYALVSFSGHMYVTLIGTLVWPLIVYLFFENYTKVGIITSLTTIITVLLLYFVGRWSERHHDSLIMKYTIGIQSVNWLWGFILFLGMALTSWSIIIIDVIHRLTFDITKLMVGKAFYEFADRNHQNPVYIITLHEFGYHMSKAIVCSFFSLVFWAVDNNPAWLAFPLSLTMFFSLSQYLIWKKRVQN